MVRKGERYGRGQAGMCAEMIYEFKEPTRMVVIHAHFGKAEVKAYCPFDAKLQAAGIWGVPFEDLQRAKVGIENEAMKQLKSEQNG